MLKKLLIFFVLCFVGAGQVLATHNRAGEITYRRLQGYTYEITILTYTKTSMIAADRPSLEVFWGDGTSDTLPRNQKINYPNDISRNTYVGIHTFTGTGIYKISMEDPNRNAGIINIPNSVNVPFYIESYLYINPFLGLNNSPKLLNPPIDNACLNKPYYHNPGAYDADGDSLSYSLVVCKGAYGQPIPGFTLPAASLSISIDPVTGTLSWLNPTFAGEYNVAILIEEWRNGFKIGSIVRDMQITVVQCNHNPPVITAHQDTCVVAGDVLSFPVTAFDPDGQYVTLTATGGPLVIANSPATFPQPVTGPGSIMSIFTWATQCSHVQKNAYSVIFKAVDNGTPVNLVSFKTVAIKVICPAPKNLIAIPDGNTIRLKWNPCACSNIKGYKIYRRNGPSSFSPSVCQTGIPASAGFTKIAELNQWSDTLFIDNNNGQGLAHGQDYCYRVVAFFADGSESIASNEACTVLIKDIPVITHVSVRSTHTITGSLYIEWSKPTFIDSVAFPPPYRYVLLHATPGSPFMPLDSFSNLNDTIFIDTLKNTVNYQHIYKINFYSLFGGNRVYIGTTQPAASLYLLLQPGDNKINITANSNVPWSNISYVLYRKNIITQQFDSIALNTLPDFTDLHLSNGTEYCYIIKSVGHYTSPGFVDPIINFSQIACAVPEDNEKPCPPVLAVSPNCESVTNFLRWTNPNHYCADDVVKYEIYYTPLKNGDFQKIAEKFQAFDTTFLHQGMNSIAACYAIVAVDSFQNKSDFSNNICVDIDSCKLYTLPNVFTPNGDNYNDRFQPFPYNFVDHIRLSVFNRWGVEVFSTNNPDINWDGKEQKTGRDCPDGVYFYVCEVYEIRLAGLSKRIISGSVTIYRK